MRVLVVTGGHPFAREPFFEMLDAIAAAKGFTIDSAEHPDVQARICAERPPTFDAILAYDMPGIRFTGADPPAALEAPSQEYVQGIHALCDAGVGFVFLHHALAGWPAWEEYAHLVGGRFHYQPARLAGVEYPDSGYQLDVRHQVEVLEPEHPVCAGLPRTFQITDELYCFPVLEDRVLPLLASDADFSSEHFSSADRAIRGEPDARRGWRHPRGSSLIGWATHARNSAIVALQPGDGPGAYANPHLRALVGNALTWVGGAEGRAWAAGTGGDRSAAGSRAAS